MSKKRKKSSEKTKNTIISSRLFFWIYTLILLLTFFKLYPTIYDNKINTGGDNAGYYILGQALAEGEGYTNFQSVGQRPHTHFPPGYPAVIAFFSKVFSNDISFIKKVNGFFLLASVILVFTMVYRFSANVNLAFISGLFTLVNAHMLSYSTIMMSEVPYVFFSLLSLWLFIKTDLRKPLFKNWMFLLFLLCTAFAYYMRTVGVALVLGVGFALLLKRNWTYIIALGTGFFILILPWMIRNKNVGKKGGYISQLVQKNPYRPELGEMGFLDWFERFWHNLERYVTREIPGGTLGFLRFDYKTPISGSEWIVGVIISLCIIFGLVRMSPKYRPLIFGYFLASFGILLLWPEVWFGVRFIFPLIPLLIFLLANGLWELLKLLLSFTPLKNNTTVRMGLPLLALLALPFYKDSIILLQRQAQGRYSNNFKNYFEVGKWAERNTPGDAIIACRKANLFYLYAHRTVTGYKFTLDQEEQVRYLDSLNVDYVVLEQLGYSSTGRYLYPAIQRYPEKFQVVYHLKDPDTYLLKFKPDIGYTGSWKGDKKEGRGIYRWENKNWFEGEWKNDMKNGKGVLHYANSQRLEANWVNDTIQGEAELWSEDGNLLRKLDYVDGVVSNNQE